MGEVAEQVGQFVTAYSGDLRDESLDGQRLVVGGIVTGLRTVITKARQAMAIATLEDLQGTLEVVVFPRLYEQTGPTWQEGAILLVAGRVDHRGEDVSLLADLVADWDEAAARGPEAFAREVAAGERGAMRRRQPEGGGGPGSNGNGTSSNGHDRGARTSAPPGVAIVGRPVPGPGIPVGPGPIPPGGGPTVAPAGPRIRPGIPFVSPLRAEARPPEADALGVLPAIAPAEPVPAYSEPLGARSAAPDRDDEPALPDEARRAAVGVATAATPAIEARPDQILHVRFSSAADADRVVGAMEALKAMLRDRPGATRVVIHVPAAAGGAPLPMELRSGIAYDAELLAEVRRRLGEGLVELRLA